MATTPPKDTKRSISSGLGYHEDADSRIHVRDVLLIVATLITAVTFQAGVNPPGGVWQDDKEPGNGTAGHKAGCAIYSSQKDAFYIFLTFNTLALSTAILVLISLTFRFPFRFEVLVATLSMLATYASSIFAIVPTGSLKYRYLLLTAAAPFLVRAVVIFKSFTRPQPAKAPVLQEYGP